MIGRTYHSAEVVAGMLHLLRLSQSAELIAAIDAILSRKNPPAKTP